MKCSMSDCDNEAIKFYQVNWYCMGCINFIKKEEIKQWDEEKE